jgi:AcrR family transcriptional regulator
MMRRACAAIGHAPQFIQKRTRNERVQKHVDMHELPAHKLNMFKTKTPKGEETRHRVLSTALAMFRARGFEQTTMREIAGEAGLSLGAAYHYFASKEAIVLGYYDSVQAEHDRRVRAMVGETRALRDRMAGAMHAKLDILEDDRPLMGALLRFTGEPSHPLSFLGARTRALQLRSIGTFAQTTAGERLPADLAQLVPLTLWALHMGLLLYFLYDESPRQRRTRQLTDGAVDLFARSLTLIKLPLLRPVRKRVATLLADAGLVPDADVIARHQAMESAAAGGVDHAQAHEEETR